MKEWLRPLSGLHESFALFAHACIDITNNPSCFLIYCDFANSRLSVDPKDHCGFNNAELVSKGSEWDSHIRPPLTWNTKQVLHGSYV